MNLREWALSQGIRPQTAYKWYRAGTLPVPARKIGQLILVGDLESQPSVSKSAVIYARVSSADQKPDLDRQVAMDDPLSVVHFVCEKDSNLLDQRKYTQSYNGPFWFAPKQVDQDLGGGALPSVSCSLKTFCTTVNGNGNVLIRIQEV